jgi:hypothetical protein
MNSFIPTTGVFLCLSGGIQFSHLVHCSSQIASQEGPAVNVWRGIQALSHTSHLFCQCPAVACPCALNVRIAKIRGIVKTLSQPITRKQSI